MGRLLFAGLVASGLVLLYLSVMQPGRLRRLGRNARTLGYAYIAAVLIGAVMRTFFGWGS
ncbi:MAG: hypothetical protein O2895_07310 [Chloroflexi bacterium]|nr:hypothetical protein [Chloroflexota bacterium]